MNVKQWLILALLPSFGCGLFENQEAEEPVVIPETLTVVKDRMGNIYEVGFDQVSNKNQDPYVLKTNSVGQEKWHVSHAASGLLEQARLVNIDPYGNPWVVFSVNGSDSTQAAFQQNYAEVNAFDSVFLSNYGYGSGAEVSILAKLDSANGKIQKATYLISRTKEGNIFSPSETNSFRVTAFGVGYNKVVLNAMAWYKPPSAESTEQNFIFHPAAVNANATGSYWEMTIEMPLDLSKLQDIQLTKANLVEEE